MVILKCALTAPTALASVMELSMALTGASCSGLSIPATGNPALTRLEVSPVTPPNPAFNI